MKFLCRDTQKNVKQPEKWFKKLKLEINFKEISEWSVDLYVCENVTKFKLL